MKQKHGYIHLEFSFHVRKQRRRVSILLFYGLNNRSARQKNNEHLMEVKILLFDNNELTTMKGTQQHIILSIHQ